MVAAASWPAWESYRVHQRLGFERAVAAMRTTLGRLIAAG